MRNFQLVRQFVFLIAHLFEQRLVRLLGDLLQCQLQRGRVGIAGKAPDAGFLDIADVKKGQERLDGVSR